MSIGWTLKNQFLLYYKKLLQKLDVLHFQTFVVNFSFFVFFKTKQKLELFVLG